MNDTNNYTRKKNSCMDSETKNFFGRQGCGLNSEPQTC
jgi:hypothetical protein